MWMSRLPARGATIATPLHNGNKRVLELTDLAEVLGQLCPGTTFSSKEIQDYFSALGAIIGAHSADPHRLETTVVGQELHKIAAALDYAVKMLEPPATGLHEIKGLSLTLELRSDVTDALAEQGDAAKQSARQDLDGFVAIAARVAKASQRAEAKLRSFKGKVGRPTLDWYDQFVALLLTISERAGVRPTLGRDATREEAWTGWLFRAATRFEDFLPLEMQSETGEARGRRLQRSKRRLNR
jgi:hypothetical protein